ncbi:hypothetical protein EC988_000912 [Linderina pennispora]|nr:hypothetical protein EC988_000912 [Linderina pennispora]
MSGTKHAPVPKSNPQGRRNKSKKPGAAQHSRGPPQVRVSVRASSEQLRRRSRSRTPSRTLDRFSDVWARKPTRAKLSLESMSLSGLFHSKSQKIKTARKSSAKHSRRRSISEPAEQPRYAMPEPRTDDPEMQRLLAMLQGHIQAQPMARPPSISMPVPPVVQPTRASVLGKAISGGPQLRRANNASQQSLQHNRAALAVSRSTPVQDDELSAFGEPDDEVSAGLAVHKPTQSKTMPSIHSRIAEAALLPPPVRIDPDACNEWARHSSVFSDSGRGSHVYTVIGKAIASAMLAQDSSEDSSSSAPRGDVGVRPVQITKQRTTGDIDETPVHRRRTDAEQSSTESANVMTPDTFATARPYMGQPSDAPFPDPPAVPLPARQSSSAPTAPLPQPPARNASRSRGSDVSAIAVRHHLQVDEDREEKVEGRDSYASDEQPLPAMVLAEWLGAPADAPTGAGTTQASTPPPRPASFAEKRDVVEALLARVADLESRFACVEAVLGGLEHELDQVVRGRTEPVVRRGKVVDPAAARKPEVRVRDSLSDSPADAEDGGFWRRENLTRYVSQSQADFDEATTQTLVSIMAMLRGLSSVRQAKQAMASIDTVLANLNLSDSQQPR